MVIRFSPQSVLLNSRLVHFPQGRSAHEVFAALAKHSAPGLPGRPAPRAPQWLPLGRPQWATGMPDHPLENIAQAVAWRLANPTNRTFLCREVKRARGSNGRKTIVKNDGALRGFADRPLSEHDIQEVRGVISLVLAELGQPEKLDFTAWKRIFREARAVLGMKRKVNRENLLDSLEGIDFHSELTMDRALLAELAADREEVAQAESARRTRIAQAARRLLSLLHTARRGDASRRARANFKTALRYLRRAVRTAMGEGHGHTLTRTAAYEQNRAFLEYIAEGEAQAARETRAAQTAWQEAETARLLYAVAE